MMLILTCKLLLCMPLLYHSYALAEQVNQKMILTLTASIMYWSLQKQPQSLSEMPEQSDPSSMASDAASDVGSEDGASTIAPSESEDVNSLSDSISNLTMDDATSIAPSTENGNVVAES